MDLEELGEFGLIERISQRCGSPNRCVVKGIGDDAAILRPSPGKVLLSTTDVLIEHVHFDLSYTDPCSLGHKALASSISDIAAMGGTPRFSLLSLGLPKNLPVEFVDDFYGGLIELGSTYNVSLVGGDTSLSESALFVCVHLLGEAEEDRIVRRGGAQPGQRIMVTGFLGESALGRTILKRMGREEALSLHEELALHHLRPKPPLEFATRLAGRGLATSMIDISDGLASDLGHIVEASGVGATVHLDKLPLSRAFAKGTETLSEDPTSLAVSGGEDFELLFTVAESQAGEVIALGETLNCQVTEVGHITSDRGAVVFLDEQKREHHVGRRGFDHFRR